MKEARIFLDTNILVYAHDTSAGIKQDISRNKLIELWESGLGVLSTQVLQEFYVVVTTKLPKKMPPDTARSIVADLLKWEVVINDGDSVLRAIDIGKRYGYSFWDSMIIGAALEGQAEVLLSEDLSHGQVLSGLKIVNPFLE
jgi:predicted nucleic acid-binding protein